MQNWIKPLPAAFTHSDLVLYVPVAQADFCSHLPFLSSYPDLHVVQVQSLPVPDHSAQLVSAAVLQMLKQYIYCLLYGHLMPMLPSGHFPL